MVPSTSEIIRTALWKVVSGAVVVFAPLLLLLGGVVVFRSAMGTPAQAPVTNGEIWFLAIGSGLALSVARQIHGALYRLGGIHEDEVKRAWGELPEEEPPLRSKLDPRPSATQQVASADRSSSRRNRS